MNQAETEILTVIRDLGNEGNAKHKPLTYAENINCRFTRLIGLDAEPPNDRASLQSLLNAMCDAGLIKENVIDRFEVGGIRKEVYYWLTDAGRARIGKG